MEQNEIDALKKFMDADLVDQLAQMESGQKQLPRRERKPENLDEFYKSVFYKRYEEIEN